MDPIVAYALGIATLAGAIFVATFIRIYRREGAVPPPRAAHVPTQPDTRGTHRAPEAALAESQQAARIAELQRLMREVQSGAGEVRVGPTGPPTVEIVEASGITPALEARLRRMMRDEILKARAREMGGGA